MSESVGQILGLFPWLFGPSMGFRLVVLDRFRVLGGFMVLDRFGDVRLGLVSGLGLPQPKRVPPKKSTDEQLQNQGVYKEKAFTMGKHALSSCQSGEALFEATFKRAPD